MHHSARTAGGGHRNHGGVLGHRLTINGQNGLDIRRCSCRACTSRGVRTHRGARTEKGADEVSYSVGQVAGFMRRDGAHPAPLRRHRPARPRRTQPRGPSALQRRRPGQAAADPVLPGARLPARRGRRPARRPGRGPPRAPAPSARTADRPDRETAEDGGGRRTRHGGTHDGHRSHPEERFEVFGDKDPEQYAEEAEQRWGGTETYAESQRRAARYTKDDWKRLQAEVDAWSERYDALMAAA